MKYVKEHLETKDFPYCFASSFPYFLVSHEKKRKRKTKKRGKKRLYGRKEEGAAAEINGCVKNGNLEQENDGAIIRLPAREGEKLGNILGSRASDRCFGAGV